MRFCKRSQRMSALVLAVSAAASASAGVLWDEAVDGDLSGDALAPNSFALAPGSNTLSATSVRNDLEYVTLTVPAGQQLSAMILTDFVSTSVQSFVGVQAGSIFTEPPTGTNVANLLGWTHFGPAVAAPPSDYLDNVGAGAGAIGFVGPLGPGAYTFWMQETGTATATYTWDFVVVPEPATLGLLALAGLALRRR